MKPTCLITALLLMSFNFAFADSNHLPLKTGMTATPNASSTDVSDESIASEDHDEFKRSHFTADQIIEFSKQFEKALSEKGALVAIVARMDEPESKRPEGMRYTEVAFAVHSLITTSGGEKIPGYAIYALQQEEKRKDTSRLIQEFPVDFFSNAAVLEAGIIIPTPKLQQRLLNVINSPTYSTLHDPHFSLIANPYTLGSQNDAEHTLDVICAALYRTSNIKRIKANEIAYFKAQPVKINLIRLKLDSLFSSEMSSSDQPGSPETATFETIASFLQKFNKGSEVLHFIPQGK